jgi:integrase
MPRKPKVEKHAITVVVNAVPVAVVLHPPTGTRSSWYAYWTGLTTSKSTGQRDLQDAILAAEQMVRSGGQRATLNDALLSDEEFEEIQRRHYGKKTEPRAKERAKKSLRECLDAIRAFRDISKLSPISQATPDDCERFQSEALKRPKNWRVVYADTKRSKKRREELGEVETLSPNTVLKWIVALQAAFERANSKAGKKCVRGVVPEAKLLTENPWRQFTWIEGYEKPLRQFDHSELASLLDYFETQWPGVSVATAFVKVLFWSWARRYEVSNLQWSDQRLFEQECHFESIGKWGVKKWFRLPDSLRADLKAMSGQSNYVFGCFPEQVRNFHLRNNNPTAAAQVRRDFVPENLGEWMYRQVVAWSESLPKGSAYLHVFRKTALQHALRAEHVHQTVAEEASVTPAVMRASYAREEDEELRRMSNRTFDRLRRSLPVEVASRYGYSEKPADRIIERLDVARSRGDWETVARLGEELTRLKS